jgi:hypothetical protein
MSSDIQTNSMNLDSSVSSVSIRSDKWIKFSIIVMLVVASVCAVLVVEIELLGSGTLVVVMPE